MRVVKSQLTHCLDLLAVMSDHARGMRLTDIADGIDAPKSSTQRLLDHLAAAGWVEQDPATGHYRITMRLAVLGQRYMQSAGIADAAQGILERIADRTRELVRLTVVDGRRLSWIASTQGAPPGLRYEPSMGAPIVSYATANGKAWLATLAEAEALAIAVAEGLGRRRGARASTGPRALRTTAQLAADLEAVRRRGYAVAEEEAEPGVAAVAVAIPDRPGGVTLGTVSVAGPIVRLVPQRYPELARILAEGACELSRAWPTARSPAVAPRRIGARP
jgi:DNA-binding IclR family transcriptional regulator